MDADAARAIPAPASRTGRAVRLAALLVGLALAACGLSSNRELPDLAAKRDGAGGSPMSAAEQKKAIDALIAKRDAQGQPER